MCSLKTFMDSPTFSLTLQSVRQESPLPESATHASTPDIGLARAQEPAPHALPRSPPGATSGKVAWLGGNRGSRGRRNLIGPHAPFVAQTKESVMGALGASRFDAEFTPGKDGSRDVA